MDGQEEIRAPGLRFDKRGRPMWRASKAAVKAGYPVKTVNLNKLIGNDRLIRERCVKLQREMDDWVSNGGKKRAPLFDGTFKALIDVYTSDPESSYVELKSSSREPYDYYLPMLRAEIGHCHIDRTDGTDLKRWFRAWSDPAVEGGRRRVARARMCIAIIKAATTFGILKRLPGCPEFSAILSASKFESLPAREQVIEAGLVVAARKAAHELGEPRLALCYAIQFEGTVRQWDGRGQWLPLDDETPSVIIYRGKKWIGPTWANVDKNLVLRFKPTKTQGTTNAEVVMDFKVCPMIMEEIALIPEEERKGPLIVNLRTDRPYSYSVFRDTWQQVRKVAKIPRDIWNRDLRASGSTEARAAGAKIDDLKKLMGHSAKSTTTGTVYDRAKLEAQRRIATARNSSR